MDINIAIDRVASLIERWDGEPIWHDPEFLDGRIHIDTRDLLAIKIVINALSGAVVGTKKKLKSILADVEGLQQLSKQIIEG